MKIPSKINIFGQEITVIIEAQPKSTEGEECEGWYLEDTSTICVKKGAPKEMAQVFFHELGHALLKRIYISQAMNDDTLEEIIVENYALTLVELFNFRLRKEDDHSRSSKKPTHSDKLP